MIVSHVLCDTIRSVWKVNYFFGKMLMIVTFQCWCRVFLFHLKICITLPSNLYMSDWVASYMYHVLYVFHFHYSLRFFTFLTLPLHFMKMMIHTKSSCSSSSFFLDNIYTYNRNAGCNLITKQFHIVQ